MSSRCHGEKFELKFNIPKGGHGWCVLKWGGSRIPLQVFFVDAVHGVLFVQGL